MADDDQVRNDFLAARGAAPQAVIDKKWQALMAAQQKPPENAPIPAQLPVDTLPIGKRIMSTVGGFFNALGGDVGDLARNLLDVAKIPGEVYQHGEPGSPEMAAQAREFASVFGVRPVPAGIRMGAGLGPSAAVAEGAGKEASEVSLAERLKEKLTGEAPAAAKTEVPKPTEAAPPTPTPAVPAETGEPTIPNGMTRLYRGETGEFPPNPTEAAPLASHILAEELPVIKIRPGHIAEDLEDQLPKLSADERWQIRMEASKGRRGPKGESAPEEEPISESELAARVQEIAQETYDRELRDGTFPGEIEPPTPTSAAPTEAPASTLTLPPAPAEAAAIPISSKNVPGEAPIVRFRKDASAIEASLPPPEDGMTRLWRGNRPGEIGSATQFTNDLPGIALPFREPYGGNISYVDVPSTDLSKFENKAGAAPGAEFSLPVEYAAKANEVHVTPAVEGAPPENAPLMRPEELPTPSPGGPAPAPASPAPAPESTPTVPPAEQAAAPARDILQLGDPLEPAVTLRATPQRAAQADITLGRMDTLEEAPAEGPTRPSGRPLGEPPSELPEPSVMPLETIHDYLAGERVDNPIKINLARIGSGEDVADALKQVSRTIPEQAVQSNEATIYAADALGLSPSDFLAGYKGQQLSASETTAIRFMLDSSASQLIDFAKAAREPMASAEAHGQFLKAFTVHRALQQYAENARAEAGRTLQSWSIMSAERANYTRAVGDLIKNVDATGDLSALASQMADMDNPLQVNRLVAQSMRGTGRDTLMTIMYNIRLSSPTTIVKKLASDVGMAMWNMATRYAAETLGSGAVASGETSSLAYGYLNSLPDAIRAGGKALKAGESQFWKDYHTMDSMDLSAYGGSPEAQATRVSQRFRLSALANGVPEPLEAGETTRGMLGYIQSALPTSWIASIDDFAKVWQYRANQRALAWRASGGDTTAFNQLLDTNPQWLHQQAFDQALKYTFQEPLTGLAANLRNMADSVNIRVPGTQTDIPLGRIVMPFIKVPANIARMAYRSSPLAYAFPSPDVRRILSTPGPNRDILQAQIGLGSAFTAGILAGSLNGNITGKGPTDPGLKREWEAAGHQPYSLEMPGARPFGLNQLEPFGMVLAATADTVNLMRFSKDEDNEKLALSLVFGVGQALMSKTYFQNASDFLDTLAHPDEDSGRYTSRLIASFVPQGIQRIANATDEWQRAHYGIMDSIEANLPSVRQNLPVAVSLWGDPLPTREAYLPFMSGHTASIFSPVPLGPDPALTEPIDKWIFDNRASFPHEEQTQRGIHKPSRTQNYEAGPGVSAQVEYTPAEYTRFQMLAGNELTDPATRLGAKDTLNGLVTGTHPSSAQQSAWDKASPAEQALMVQTIVGKFRTAAKAQMLEDFDDIRRAVQAGAESRAQQLQGAGR